MEQGHRRTPRAGAESAGASDPRGRPAPPLGSPDGSTRTGPDGWHRLWEPRRAPVYDTHIVPVM